MRSSKHRRPWLRRRRRASTHIAQWERADREWAGIDWTPYTHDAAVLKAMLPIGAAHDLSIMYSQRKNSVQGRRVPDAPHRLDASDRYRNR